MLSPDSVQNPILMKAIVLLLAAMTMWSCKSYHLADVERGRPLTEKLPPLIPEFDGRAFRPGTGTVLQMARDVIVNGKPDIKGTANMLVQNERITRDSRQLFKSQFLDKICEPVGKSQGYAVCRLLSRSSQHKSWVNPIVSTFTLYLPNLFGYTYSTIEDNVELIVDVYNLDDEVVASYTGLGNGTAKVKMYKGYSLNSAKRMAHAQAFGLALEDIKQKMSRDIERIRLEL